MKHDRTFFAATGIPSLFLIFSVLCLAVLSLLTLGKSRDELQAANFAIQQTDLYYKTCETATGTVTAIQKQLASDYSQVSDPDAYFSLAGLMKLTVSHTILLRMLFHSRKRYLIHRSYL